ncbi:MAG: glycosyltransferase [Oscillatoria sp. PMC 1051.18]|nr:glycosyltransferase [Oscillatoria sp. PMC 1050.18]MEC5031637.1 glycosyltransferase [Oscillatoria sp. PMC 1051.18]
MKLVSVVIPVYGVEKYIAASITSVLAQTYSNFELLLVIDGSCDRSKEICEQFSDRRLKIIQQENRGVSAARNNGIRHSQGEYLAFLDADDLWLPEKLAYHVEHLENNPQVGVSFSRSAFIDEEGKSLGIYQMPRLKDIVPVNILCRNPVGNGSAPVVRRQTLEDIKYQKEYRGNWEDCYFDEQLHHQEDIECWLRISLKTSWQVEGIPEALTLYRVNFSGASTNIYKQLDYLETMLAKTEIYAPELIARWGNATRAYQLRYVARRLVSLRDGGSAVKLTHQAIATYPQIILAEPRRTFLTLAAAYSLWLLPQKFYQRLESFVMEQTGKTQKRRILKDRD